MKFLFYSLFIFLVLLNGCDNILDENNSYDYSLEQQMGCFCPQGGIWVKLFVKADTVSKAIRISDNSLLSYNEFRFYKSIKGLFDEISQRDTSTYDVEINMDSINNYPTYVYFNPKPIVNGDTVQVISDAQLSYTTKNYSKSN